MLATVEYHHIQLLAVTQKLSVSTPKREYQPGGTSGLLSYAYGGNNDGQKRIVVFWKVPQFGSNKFGIAWSKLDTQNPPNPDGRRQPNVEVIDTEPNAVMYNNFLRGSLPRGQFAVGTARENGNLTISNEQDGVILIATMADNTHAVLKVEFRSQEQQKVVSSVLICALYSVKKFYTSSDSFSCQFFIVFYWVFFLLLFFVVFFVIVFFFNC